MSAITEFGNWMRERRQERAQAYLAAGNEISPFSEGDGEFGAYRRTTQWFRNMFVQPESGAPDTGWGEGWASESREDTQRLAAYLGWLNGYVANWTPGSPIEKTYPGTADPEKYRAAIEIRDRFLETFPHLKPA